MSGRNEKSRLKPTLFIICCPTWIRTKTNRTKICRTTIILSGNTPFLGTAKISDLQIEAKCFFFERVTHISLRLDQVIILFAFLNQQELLMEQVLCIHQHFSLRYFLSVEADATALQHFSGFRLAGEDTRFCQ